MARPKIAPCLWFDDQAEDAARFYTSLFADSSIDRIDRYGEGAPKPAGSVLMVSFRLAGIGFQALNGGPQYKFSEAVSMSVDCVDQAEVDRLWEALCEGGEPGQCGWLKDRFGLSWQIVPRELMALMQGPDKAGVGRMVGALMGMSRIDVAALRQAYEG